MAGGEAANEWQDRSGARIWSAMSEKNPTDATPVRRVTGAGEAKGTGEARQQVTAGEG